MRDRESARPITRTTARTTGSRDPFSTGLVGEVHRGVEHDEPFLTVDDCDTALLLTEVERGAGDRVDPVGAGIGVDDVGGDVAFPVEAEQAAGQLAGFDHGRFDLLDELVGLHTGVAIYLFDSFEPDGQGFADGGVEEFVVALFDEERPLECLAALRDGFLVDRGTTAVHRFAGDPVVRGVPSGGEEGEVAVDVFHPAELVPDDDVVVAGAHVRLEGGVRFDGRPLDHLHLFDVEVGRVFAAVDRLRVIVQRSLHECAGHPIAQQGGKHKAEDPEGDAHGGHGTTHGSS